jgi:hypothetical protein
MFNDEAEEADDDRYEDEDNAYSHEAREAERMQRDIKQR